jgi:hypothetical protein
MVPPKIHIFFKENALADPALLRYEKHMLLRLLKIPFL